MKKKKIMFAALAALIFTASYSSASSSQDQSGDSSGSDSNFESIVSDSEASDQNMDEPDKDADSTLDTSIDPETVSDSLDQESKQLILYFSCTGNTEAAAKQLASYLGNADLYQIEPEVPYTEEDLNYSDDSCRANQEQSSETARPAFEALPENLDSYDEIYLGYPIWWGIPPKIILSVGESSDWSGNELYPFCTSGGSSFSAQGLEEAFAGAVIHDGIRIGSEFDESSFNSWISES